MIMGFDGYSFCKPHSASYTMVAYKSAWLRAHYPAEFMAAVISNGGGYYSTYGYISEARRMGIRILPPDINSSEIKYTGKEKTIRIGFMQIGELSTDAKDSIIHERNRNGLFLSFNDFLRRMSGHIHLQDVKALIKAGAIDSIGNGINRPGLVWQALEFFNHQEENSLPTLFDYGKSHAPVHQPALNRKEYSRQVALKNESEALGFILSMHPLELYRDTLKGIHYIEAKDLSGYIGRYVTMTGWLVTGKTVMTKEGDQMKFISFEDTTGIYETVFFPKVYNRYCHMLNAARPYLLKGKVDMDFGSINVNVQWVGFLDRYKR
jgi:error-prone DNA polymerase